jgi:hypothetical protein
MTERYHLDSVPDGEAKAEQVARTHVGFLREIATTLAQDVKAQRTMDPHDLSYLAASVGLCADFFDEYVQLQEGRSKPGPCG